MIYLFFKQFCLNPDGTALSMLFSFVKTKIFQQILQEGRSGRQGYQIIQNICNKNYFRSILNTERNKLTKPETQTLLSKQKGINKTKKKQKIQKNKNTKKNKKETKTIKTNFIKSELSTKSCCFCVVFFFFFFVFLFFCFVLF